MNNKEYLMNEFGLEIAREKNAKQIADLMDKEINKDLKIGVLELLKQRDEIEKGNVEIIKKYIGEMDVE